MTPHEAAAMAAIDAEYEALVTYTGAGLNGGFVQAIKSDVPGATAQGFDGRARQVSFEIAKPLLPGEPDNGDRIVEEGGAEWSVTDVTDRGDINRWFLVVEERP